MAGLSKNIVNLSKKYKHKSWYNHGLSYLYLSNR
jgi:hypothetical protein